MPSIQTIKLLWLKEFQELVLNLVINGMPSIQDLLTTFKKAINKF